MCKAFKCNICGGYYDGDPYIQEVHGSYGIIWSPENGNKQPSNINDMCPRCFEAYREMRSKLVESMTQIRLEEEQIKVKQKIYLNKKSKGRKA